MTKKAAENVPRRGYNFYIQLKATPAYELILITLARFTGWPFSLS